MTSTAVAQPIDTSSTQQVPTEAPLRPFDLAELERRLEAHLLIARRLQA